MKVEITCAENTTFISTLEVQQLDFDEVTNSFSMRVVVGDDWIGQRITSQLEVVPVRVQLDPSKAAVQFERYRDAAAFGEWLIAADAKVAHGFRTMRG